MQTILVTGGCGYIGAHTIVDLIENGFNVISVDNLSRSSENSLAGIEKITGKVTVFNKSENNPKAPGMLLKHYAPQTDFILSRTLLDDIDWYADKKIGVLLFLQSVNNLPLEQQIVLAPNGDFETAAARLYDAMHELDSRNFDIIIAERFPDYGLGCTINDRLERATHKKTTHLKL